MMDNGKSCIAHYRCHHEHPKLVYSALLSSRLYEFSAVTSLRKCASQTKRPQSSLVKNSVFFGLVTTTCIAPAAAASSLSSSSSSSFCRCVSPCRRRRGQRAAPPVPQRGVPGGRATASSSRSPNRCGCRNRCCRGHHHARHSPQIPIFMPLRALRPRSTASKISSPTPSVSRVTKGSCSRIPLAL